MNGFDLGPQALEADRRRLLALLTEKSYAKKKVVLSSGRESDFYIDCKKTVLTAEGHWLVGRLMFAQIAKESATAVGVGGLTMGADPLASSVALISHLANKPLQAFLVRKEPKGHGTGQWLEAAARLDRSRPVVIVEDVVTTGGSSIKAIERAIESGLTVAAVVALVDRLEGGRAAIEAHAPLCALFDRRDFLP